MIKQFINQNVVGTPPQQLNIKINSNFKAGDLSLSRGPIKVNVERSNSVLQTKYYYGDSNNLLESTFSLDFNKNYFNTPGWTIFVYLPIDKIYRDYWKYWGRVQLEFDNTPPEIINCAFDSTSDTNEAVCIIAQNYSDKTIKSISITFELQSGYDWLCNVDTNVQLTAMSITQPSCPGVLVPGMVVTYHFDLKRNPTWPSTDIVSTGFGYRAVSITIPENISDLNLAPVILETTWQNITKGTLKLMPTGDLILIGSLEDVYSEVVVTAITFNSEATNRPGYITLDINGGFDTLYGYDNWHDVEDFIWTWPISENPVVLNVNLSDRTYDINPEYISRSGRYLYFNVNAVDPNDYTKISSIVFDDFTDGHTFSYLVPYPEIWLSISDKGLTGTIGTNNDLVLS